MHPFRLALAAVCLPTAVAVAQTPPDPSIHPHHFLVDLAPGIAPEKWAASFGGPVRLERVLSPKLGLVLVVAEGGLDDASWLQAFQSHRGVEAAQMEHYIADRVTVPNDPGFGQQWHHVESGDHDIDSDEAWDITTGGTSAAGDRIVVAVLETGGSNFNHTDLQGNHWINVHEIADNGVDDDGNGYVDDYNGWNTTAGNDNVAGGGHGTSVSGMIGGTGDNGLGGVGVNWDVEIMQIDIANGLTESNVIAGYEYARVMRELYNETGGDLGAFVVVTNASWGVDQANPANYPVWCAFYEALGEVGILNCGATTNSALNVDVVGDMPTACSSDFMISVTATDDNDVRTFSGYGLTTIDLGAPGDNVYLPSGNTNYNFTSGTSFASPCVAGAVALVYSAPCPDLAALALANPAAAALLVRSYILDGVDPVNALSDETVTGGRLNVLTSLQLALGNCGPIVCEPGTFEATFACRYNAETDAVETDLLVFADLASFLCNPDSLCVAVGSQGGYTCDVWPADGILAGVPSGANMQVYYTVQGLASDTLLLESLDCASSVPGCTDPAATNYEPEATFNDGSCDYPCENVVLTFLTDCWPDESAWQIVAADGTVVAGVQEGDYLDEATLYVWEGCVPIGCHTLVVTDAYGDGVNGTQWNGLCAADGDFYLTVGGAVAAAMAEPDFGESVSIPFCLPVVPGCTDATACNFDAAATANDGSCEVVGQGTISGPTSPMSGVAVTYTYDGPADHVYTWSVTGGAITSVVSGVGVVSVEVVWGDGISGGAGTITVTQDNGAGCTGSASGSAIAVLPNSVEALEGGAELSAFPNPATDVITLETGRSGAYSVRVFDVRGALVAEVAANASRVQLDCSTWPAGTYTVEVVGGSSVAVTVVR